MKKIAIICTLLLLTVFNSMAQQAAITVSGVVTDENKEPLIGVNITVKNVAGLGTITDINGRYTINIEPYNRLIFSYIGYTTQEVLIKDQKQVNVVMTENVVTAIDEVVITGTGAQTKLTQTGAITTVDVETLKSNPSSSIVNALAGNVAGVIAMQTSGQPGKNISEFWIRGISTFGAGTGAYVLVDGFERSMDEINIEDIETFSVLKDASATAIYGSKGANGVVLITTKHGKAGKINISVKAESTYNMRTITPEFEDAYSYASLLNEARITRNYEPIYKPEELDILRYGLDPDLYPNVDWMDLLLKDGAWQHRVNLNMNGGGSTARYFLSVSYLDEQGMYNTDDSLKDDYNTNANYRRYNYRLNTDIDITKTTLLKVGLAGYLSKRNSPGLGDTDVWGELFGYTPVSTPVLYSNGYVPAVGTGNRTNPWVSATQTGFNSNWKNAVQTNVSLEQDLKFITKGLRFVGRYGYDTYNNNYINRRKWPEQWVAEMRDAQTGELIYKKISDSSNLAQTSGSDGNRREFLDLMLSWERAFKVHRLNATLKYTQDAYVQTQGNGEDLKNGIDKRNQDLAGRVAYNYNYRYFVDFNFGYNGSENFAKGHRFGFFPAFSLAWNVAEEKFIKEHFKWIGMFKIRFSHGRVGNDKLHNANGVEIRFPYLYTIGGGATYNWANSGSNQSYTGLHYTGLASENVTWEVATKNDLGVDLALFNDNLRVTVDYFDESRSGIYQLRNFLPGMIGLEGLAPSANVGKVTSKGFDGNFSYKHRFNNVNVTVRGNFTYSKNKIIERDEANNVYAYQLQKGYRVNQNKGLIALGLFKDYDDIRNSPTQQYGPVMPGDIKYKDVNGDGVVNDGDIVAVGSTNKPSLIYGLGMSVVWKGLDVNLHLQGAGKSQFFTLGKCIYAFTEGQWGNIIKGTLDNRWISADISGDPSTENPNASYPRLSYTDNGNGNTMIYAYNNNYRNSTFWLRNSSYLRLKTLDIGYSLPKALVNKLHFNKVRIFLTGTNLLTWSKFKLWDPEMNASRGEQYPLAKSVTLGLSVNL